MDDYLAALPFLKKLPRADLERVSRAFLPRKYARGRTVFSEGAPADAAYLLKSGLVKAMKLSPKDDPVILEIIVPGHLFGMMAALDKRPYPVDAVCLQDCEIYRVRTADFAELMRRHPPFSEAVFAEVGEHLRHSQALRAMAKEPAERRIGYILWMLSLSLGPDMRLGRDDVAEMAGTTVETAIRVLGRLRAAGLVEARWKRVKVLKPEVLRDGAF
ncbi:MAG: Crp/Fnr family transcriptional regulator [Elusimicrobia bacterium]|nr:Crp/Fnr family transcriptional regulator [Elusimicrobiota bacterium]